jgi:hypothetical protein
MAGRQLHKLYARKVETTTDAGRHSDGGGLYLILRWRKENVAKTITFCRWTENGSSAPCNTVAVGC